MNNKSTSAKAPKAPAKRRKAVKASDANALTLRQLQESYVRHLEEAGKSAGTRFSYEMELNLAAAQLGAETPIASLTTEQVQAFFESDAVTKTRKGRAKAKPTVDKTRRVLRLALAWAAAERLIPVAPIPTVAKPEATTSDETA